MIFQGGLDLLTPPGSAHVDMFIYLAKFLKEHDANFACLFDSMPILK